MIASNPLPGPDLFRPAIVPKALPTQTAHVHHAQMKRAREKCFRGKCRFSTSTRHCAY